MEEQLQRVYNEIRKEIVKDTLKLMNDTSSEYITLSGKAFLDGLQVNGECIEVVSKDKYKELEERYRTIKLDLLNTKKDLTRLNNKLSKTTEVKQPKQKKKLFNLF